MTAKHQGSAFAIAPEYELSPSFSRDIFGGSATTYEFEISTEVLDNGLDRWFEVTLMICVVILICM